MVLDWYGKGTRRTGNFDEERMDGVRRMISKVLTEEYAEKRGIMENQHFFGV